jgi:hypothetical protein
MPEQPGLSSQICNAIHDCMECSVTADTYIALAALLVSLVSLAISIYFWRQSFRPIVTASVRTHTGGNVSILYNLVILNSGVIPARKISIKTDLSNIERFLGSDATVENRRRWLSCFDENNIINILHNGDKITCSFGTTSSNDAGFWKYKAKIPITIKYEGWFGKKYSQEQDLIIIDSDSFTGFMWGE